jgi:hypothetical protein
MSRFHKPDPYNGFKCDVERRRALNARALCKALVVVSIALSQSSIPLKEILLWLKTLFL